MSWSVSVPPTAAEEFVEAVKAAKIDDTYNKPELVEQWRDQLEAAKRAVLAIYLAETPKGTFGLGGTYSASMSGHANHNGAGDGTDYTASEFVYVNVQHAPAPATSESEVANLAS